MVLFSSCVQVPWRSASHARDAHFVGVAGVRWGWARRRLVLETSLGLVFVWLLLLLVPSPIYASPGGWDAARARSYGRGRWTWHLVAARRASPALSDEPRRDRPANYRSRSEVRSSLSSESRQQTRDSGSVCRSDHSGQCTDHTVVRCESAPAMTDVSSRMSSSYSCTSSLETRRTNFSFLRIQLFVYGCINELRSKLKGPPRPGSRIPVGAGPDRSTGAAGGSGGANVRLLTAHNARLAAWPQAVARCHTGTCGRVCPGPTLARRSCCAVRSWLASLGSHSHSAPGPPQGATQYSCTERLHFASPTPLTPTLVTASATVCSTQVQVPGLPSHVPRATRTSVEPRRT